MPQNLGVALHEWDLRTRDALTQMEDLRTQESINNFVQFAVLLQLTVVARWTMRWKCCGVAIAPGIQGEQ